MQGMDSKRVVEVLGEIAQTAAETLELQEVFSRVAASIRTVIPFDNMGVVRILDGQWAVFHATTRDCTRGDDACSEPMPLSDWSPRMRPRAEPVARIDDAQVELDPGYRGDAAILLAGVRSTLWQSFRSADRFSGGVWLSSFQPAAFSDDHQELLKPIAALLGSAVDHWRIWDAQRRRGERLDRLEVLLETLAQSLDIRDVFDRISDAVRPVLPHDALALTEHDSKIGSFRVAAFAGQSDVEAPKAPIALTPAEKERRTLDHEIFHDMPAELIEPSERNRLLLATGMRSWLRVPIRLTGEVRGSLGFGHREPARYDPGDVEVARRIADRIALALSHQRLAEEARVVAQERERAERLEATVNTLTRELEAAGRGRVIGVSGSWHEVLRQAGRVASSETTVLITGESGTGKEVVSRLIHQGSPRAEKPFVAINCAALPEQLLESELFGHEKGSFTGAIATKIGRLEQAAGGTLFLDEIAEMIPLVQAKLLRVLQEREFQRVGGTRTLKTDVRVIAATNRDLAVLLTRGEFREDLFYRLNVFEIPIPPLRERPDDILPLADAFVEDLGRTMGRPAAGISCDAREGLLAHSWPGNVRELRNAIERAILLCDGGLITRQHLPAGVRLPATTRARDGQAAASPVGALPPDGVDLEAVDRDFVAKALEQTRGNKSQAARLLRLTRAQLYSRIEKYRLS